MNGVVTSPARSIAVICPLYVPGNFVRIKSASLFISPLALMPIDIRNTPIQSQTVAPENCDVTVLTSATPNAKTKNIVAMVAAQSGSAPETRLIKRNEKQPRYFQPCRVISSVSGGRNATRSITATPAAMPMIIFFVLFFICITFS